MLLRDLIEQVRGVSYKPSDVVDNTGTPILRANNIQNGVLVFDELVYLRRGIVKEKQLLSKGDIVICASSGSKELVGKAAVFEGFEQPVSFGAFCKAVRVKEIKNVNKDYVRLFFQSPSYRRQISESSTGSNINNIKTENIDNLVINVPNIETQNKATQLISTILKLLDSKNKYLKLLDELVKTKFEELFGSNSKIELKEFCTFFSGYAFKSQLFQENGVPIIRISNIQNSEINDDFVFYPKDKSESLSRFKVVPNDILIAMSGATTGKVGLFREKGLFLLNQRVGCIRSMPGKSDSKFLFAYLNSEKVQAEVLEASAGCAQPNISGAQIQSLLVPNVSFSEQTKFGQWLESIDKCKFETKKQINHLEELLEKVMQEFYGGGY